LFFPEFIITENAIIECANHVKRLILENKNIVSNINVDFAVGVSGTVDTIYDLSQAKKNKRLKDPLNGYEFPREEFEEFYDQIMNLKTPAERKLVPGMEAKRADIIPAGLIILKEIFKLFEIKKIVISEYALREGIVIDTAQKFSQF
jgi:exopolyphosphatase/guanosine-5'-triphosphate,3'-diphosphate pyrophosphatase